MNAPVDLLRFEHRLTRRMVKVLRAVAERVEQSPDFPATDVARVLSYFREFVEQVHHQRESAVLYPIAAMAGGEQAAEVVGSLVAEHDESKVLLNSLVVFWEPDGLLEAERPAFAELSRTYAARLERHMECEEELLFPLADEIPGDEQLLLLEEFERIGRGHRDATTWEGEIVEELEARYLL